MIDLLKRAETAKKIILTKGIDPKSLKVNMKLLVDQSGSMRPRYLRGDVQDLCERVLAVGMNMDINKSIEVFAFNHEAEEVGVATQNNYRDFMRRINVFGGTNYTPVMNMVWKGYTAWKEHTKVEEPTGFFDKLFGKKRTTTTNERVSVPSSLNETVPTMAVMVTDGENDDQEQTIRLVRQSSGDPIFWQFIGIGGHSFRFLKRLNDLDGRIIDNANFFEVEDLNAISDEDLYGLMLNEFPKWHQAAKSKGILK